MVRDTNGDITPRRHVGGAMGISGGSFHGVSEFTRDDSPRDLKIDPIDPDSVPARKKRRCYMVRTKDGDI